MTLDREAAKKRKGEEAPTTRLSRPYVSNNKEKRDDRSTERKVARALEEDKKKYGAEEHDRRVREKIREDLERGEREKQKERERAARKIERIDRRVAEGKADPGGRSTAEEDEDDYVDNTVLNVLPTPDPRNARFGAPLSTDVRLADKQREFDNSERKRAVIWRPGTSPVRSGGEEEEERKREEDKEAHELIQEEDKRSERYVENMKLVYEGVEKEALTVREMMEKTGADPDDRRDLVLLAAQLIDVNQKLIQEKQEEGKGEWRGRSRSEASGSRSRIDSNSKRVMSTGTLTKKSSFRQERHVTHSSSGEED